MSEMVERIERAILKGMRERWNPPAIARMAIEAMREPTIPMMVAGDDCGECVAMNVYQAMIDEALK